MGRQAPAETGGGDQVLAALDASRYTLGVCRHAAWAAARLALPLTCLHVVEGRSAAGGPGAGFLDVDPAGGGPLLDEAALLEATARLEGEARGRLLLQQAALAARAPGLEVRARIGPGSLSGAFAAMAPEAALFVIGRRGEHSEFGQGRIGSQVERVVRSTGRPLLVASRAFPGIQRVLVAFEGSEGGRRRLDWVARSPLFAGLDVRLVVVGEEPARAQLDWALRRLEAAGLQAAGKLVQGDPQEMICLHADAVRADLLVMGAYGGSRIRQLLLGSTTSMVLRTARIPVLLLH